MDKKKLNKKISELANEYYLQRGKTPGHEKEDWLRAEKKITSKEESKELIFLIAIVQLLLCLFIGSNLLNIVLDIGIFLMIDCFILAAVIAIKNILKKRYCILIILGLLIPLLLANSKKIFNIVTLVVPSEMVELKYDLKSECFLKKLALESNVEGARYALQKINDHYRITLPHKISDVITFYTSYDRDGQRMGGNLWINGIDFTIKGNYIESKHDLNEFVNDGKGRHLIKYKYRISFWEVLRKPARFLKSLIK